MPVTVGERLPLYVYTQLFGKAFADHLGISFGFEVQLPEELERQVGHLPGGRRWLHRCGVGHGDSALFPQGVSAPRYVGGYGGQVEDRFSGFPLPHRSKSSSYRSWSYKHFTQGCKGPGFTDLRLVGLVGWFL